MNKTPISILQEYGMREGFVPVYTSISEQVDNNFNIFKIQVKYKNLIAVGTASNKKKAKHEAAQNMIILINDIASTSKNKEMLLLKENISEMKPILPLQDIDKVNLKLKINPKVENVTNYVGKLQEYCILNKFVQPEYEVNDVKGLPHLREYTMSCRLGAIIEEATSTTKKQAKQLAAKQLLDRLVNSNAMILAEKCDTKVTDKSIKEEDKEEDKDEDKDEDILTKLGVRLLKLNCHISQKSVEQKYRELTNKSNISRDITGNVYSIKDYHLFIKHVVRSNICSGKEEELDTIYRNVNKFKVSLSKITNSHDNTIGTLPFDHILKYIKEILKLDIEKRIISCKDPLLKAIAYKISAPIPVIQFGINKNLQVADAIALHNILDTIMIYLK